MGNEIDKLSANGKKFISSGMVLFASWGGAFVMASLMVDKFSMTNVLLSLTAICGFIVGVVVLVLLVMTFIDWLGTIR